MDTHNQFFRPDAIQVSKFHWYSLGVVAANMAISSKIIKVVPIEEFTMLDGELDDNVVAMTSDGQDASGADYSTSVNTSNAITATWLPMCGGNRLTAPNVRRGAKVAVYQFGDSDKYYWTTLHDDSQLRKLETVIWGFSGTKDEGAENNASNMYYFEVSTHTGLIALHTSTANGEFTTWDLQIDAKNGKLMIYDGVGQKILIDAQAHTIRLENVDQSILDLTKEVATFVTRDQINMKTKTWTVETETTNMTMQHTTIKGNDMTIQEQTTTLTSPTTTVTASDSLHVSSNNLAIDGAVLNCTSQAVTFEGMSFIVMSPIIVLG